ncbi:nucleotidyltransferase family protein [Beijerinckia sp. L45]|uniref:nucleotidyltransferase family protein n=1 Tax=Beijerinckia sp. L45 TaxID=1641855 RepID=UPI001FEFD5F5|nr:nucleotidyltransferase domain-containing protein [Beijerinckia sp. L45]
MTEDEMILAAMNDPDARPMSDAMLSVSDAQRRLERSRHHRVAAAEALARDLAGVRDQPSIAAHEAAKSKAPADAIGKDEIIATLRAAELELRAVGVIHIALFGSVARDEQGAGSDIDIMVEIDPAARLGLWEYAGVVSSLEDMFPVKVDVANRETLKPHVRPSAERDAIYAF